MNTSNSSPSGDLTNGTEPKQGGAPKPWYGNFVGPGPDDDPFNLHDRNGRLLKPIDMLDAAAQLHDLAYYRANTGGIMGALFNTTVHAADYHLAQAALTVIAYSAVGIPDQVTGKPISAEELWWAYRIQSLFSSLSSLKEF